MTATRTGLGVAITHEATVTLTPSLHAATLTLRDVEKFCERLRGLGADGGLEIVPSATPVHTLHALVDLSKVSRAEAR